jgi:hypothetical protein
MGSLQKTITFFYSINWQHPTPFLSVWLIIIGVVWIFDIIYTTLLFFSSDGNGIESMAGKTGWDIM